MKTTPVFPFHPTPEILEEYSFGRLEGRETDAVEQHLLLCQPCQAALAEIDEYIRLMKGATAGPLPQRPAYGRTVAWGSLAALSAGCLTLLMMAPPPLPSQPMEVKLMSFRGGVGAEMPHAPSGRSLDLALQAPDVPEASQYRVELVTSEGQPAWSGSAQPREGKLHALLPGTMARGDYWMRLYGPDSQLLYEYGLTLR